MNGMWRIRAWMSLLLLFHPLFLQPSLQLVHPACNNLSSRIYFLFISTRKLSVHVREKVGCRWHASAKKGNGVFLSLFICFIRLCFQFSRSRFESLSTESEIHHPADESLSTDSWLKELLREQTADRGAAGYLEEGLLHSEAGQQNWWAMSSSSSSLPTDRKMSRERQRERQRFRHIKWMNGVIWGKEDEAWTRNELRRDDDRRAEWTVTDLA